MTNVRAKFYVGSVENPEGAAAGRVQLHAVCRGVENAMWSQATPSGTISMYVKNDPALEAFEQGAEYEVTFRKVPKPAPGDGHEIVEAVNMHGQVVCEFCGLGLGWTDEKVAEASYYAEYVTPEKLAEYRRQHDEVYGSKE